MTVPVPGSEVRTFIVPRDLAGARLDVALARLAADLTRSRIRKLVQGGHVRLSGRIVEKAAARLHGGEPVEMEVEPPPETRVIPQALPLSVLFEDEEIIVLDKAAGMVVHPARGSPHSTLVNALLGRWRGLGEGGLARSPRLGLVHRLDKGTSGCLVVARTEASLKELQAQWKGRTVEKVYLAICHGRMGEAGLFETPYGRHGRDRTRFTGKGQGPRRASTEWRTVERFGSEATLVEIRLHTGRTHQIRVHFSEAGHPLLADAVYGGARREGRAPGSRASIAARAIGRQALHASRLAFDHPITGRRLVFEAPLPEDFRRALAALRAAQGS